MKKKALPQLTVQKMKPLLSFDEIEKGTHIHQRNDQSEVHWEYTTYIIIGTSNSHLLCKDLGGKRHAFAWEDLPDLDFKVIVG